MLNKDPVQRCSINDVMKSDWIKQSIGVTKSLTASKNMQNTLSNMSKFNVVMVLSRRSSLIK